MDSEITSKAGEHPNMTVAVIDPKDNYAFVVNPPRELIDWMDGHCLADVQCEGCPEQAGIYICTIERHFQQGWSEGYKADGESDYWVVLNNVRQIDLSEYIAPS